MAQAAIASGSFPLAFAPRDLRRWDGAAWADHYFQDGGTYDNDPIGQTINGGVPQAPIGHRQPRASDVPDEKNPMNANDAMSKEDAALDKKIKSICRGC